MIYLILGGARSGKSARAQELAITLAERENLDVTYIATATVTDDEMGQRILHHQNNRPADWQLREVPLELAACIQQLEQPSILLVDCLTLWLNNQLYQHPQPEPEVLFDQLADACEQYKAHIIVVANEVGLGVIPMGQVTRQFVDEAGRLNQRMAKVADCVEFVAAGLPLVLKDPSKEGDSDG